MRRRPLVILLVLTVAVLATAFAMRGKGHRALMHWLPAIHGHR